MKLAMSRLDIMVCVRELKNAIGARVENSYEADGSVLLSLRMMDGKRMILICEMGRRINLTSGRPKLPKRPGSFAMLLRKHIRGAELSGIEQPWTERVVVLEFSGIEKRYLVVELFGRGNIILCDGSMKILHPYRSESHMGRTVRTGEAYVIPPGPRINPDSIVPEELREQMRGAPDLVRALAVNLGLGGALAEEICSRSGLGKSLSPSSISNEDLKTLAGSIHRVFTSDPDPVIVYDEGRPLDVLPFWFKIYTGRECRKFPSFNEALDEYFAEVAVISASERARRRLETEIERLKKILSEEQDSFSRLYEQSVWMKRRADVISLKHHFVDGLLDQVRGALRKAGSGGAMDFIRSAAASGAWWAPSVRTLRRSGEVVVDLMGEEVTLDLKFSAFQNASRYYEGYKKFAEKAAGAKKAAERTAVELDRLQRMGLSAFQPPRKEEKIWFEKYRWALSSGGFLILGGRDEKTNSEIVRKRMGDRDIYLHAEIRGAPHVIIRSGGREVPVDDIREAAEFAAMHSRAWIEGMGSTRVFWVRPDQVSARAPPGTYLPKGSFVIRGERNYIDVPLRAALGVVGFYGREIVMCGPVSAVRNHSRIVIEVSPGGIRKREAAEAIRRRMVEAGFNFSIDEVERAMPPGDCRIA
ncbi:MAG: ribosome rescue protein RqcH [Candidatus Hadarchaeales archaeon]